MHGIIENLINQLTRLPGIGRKSAQRLAFFILSMPESEAMSIADAIRTVKQTARFCSQCFNITEDETCGICSDPSRDRSRVCVVEEPSNILVMTNPSEGGRPIPKLLDFGIAKLLIEDENRRKPARTLCLAGVLPGRPVGLGQHVPHP